MRAVTWHGAEDVRVDDVPEPWVQDAQDAIIRVTSTAICGSDLHLYRGLGMHLNPGDIIGHEAMGIVEDVGPDVDHISRGDRVVVPCNISCGACFMCGRGLFAQCETTQVSEHGKGAALFGHTRLYGGVAGAQAEYLRVPQAQFGPVKMPDSLPDDRFLYLSDVLPTAWQAVELADIPPGGSVAVIGLGPVGQLCGRIARYRGARALGVDLVDDRLTLAAQHGIETVDVRTTNDIPERLRSITDGRGPDAAIDAVGMEAHGSPIGALAQRIANALPNRIAAPMVHAVGIDQLGALLTAIDSVRRGGTVSVVGVYGGAVDPLPMMDMFDKGLTLRMGRADVKRWIPDLLPLVMRHDDPLGVEQLATHRLPLEQAPYGYEIFHHKVDGCIKVVLQP